MRETIRRTHVDKIAKVFNIADEFIVHAFKAHLKANICRLLKVSDTTENIPHLCTQQWLHDTADYDMIIKSAVMPTKFRDPTHSLHRSTLATFMLI